MCLIVTFAPELAGNSRLDWQRIRNAAERNRDGFGLAFPSRGRLIIERSLEPDGIFALAAENERRGRPFLLHLRFATAGDDTVNNAHPFPIGQRLAFAHNGHIHSLGILRTLQALGPRASDTAALADIARRRTARGLEPLEAFASLRSLAGDSRLAAINSDGEFRYINESLGQREGGAWYSVRDGGHFDPRVNSLNPYR